MRHRGATIENETARTVIQNKVETKLQYSGWRSTAGADLIGINGFYCITGWRLGGHCEGFPVLPTVARLSCLPSSSRSMAVGWFHSSLHCHPEQINVTMRKARAALFLKRANLLLESLSDLLYSLYSTTLGEKKKKRGARLRSLLCLGYGVNSTGLFLCALVFSLNT